MKKIKLLLAAGLTLALLNVGPVGAAPKGSGSGANGGFQMTVHSHSNDNPNFPGLLFPTDRLAFDFAQGDDFSYSSRVCGGPAPFNDLGLDFRPDYPGVDDDADGTAPVRHGVDGTITEVDGDRGTIQGTITSVLCATENGHQVETENSIFTEFEAKYVRVSDNEVRLSGTFELSPTESTGTFAGIEGQGSIKASLTCLANQRDPSQPTCADRGHFADFVGVRGDPTKPAGELAPGLVGSFRDDTVLPV